MFIVFSIILLSFIEALTEFAPVSSTAHLLLFVRLLGLESNPAFEVAIIVMQLGAILAVVFLYKNTLLPANFGVVELKKFSIIYSKLALAFVPTGLCGILFYKTIKQIFFTSPLPSAILLIVGGLLLIKKYNPTKQYSLESIPLKFLLIIGLFQAVSIFPGVSRAGATIVCALMLGLDNRTAFEISFFLALPTILSASIYEIVFGSVQGIAVIDILQQKQNLIIIGSCFMLSFIFASLIVPKIIAFGQKYGVKMFGYYRIALGLCIIVFSCI